MEREYGKYEFCNAKRCKYLIHKSKHCKETKCIIDNTNNCPYTAKKFHEWLQMVGFKIVLPKY